MPLSSALATETIVVQSRGMERWIALEISRRHGIFANCSFPFPNAFLQQLFSSVMANIPPKSPFDADILTVRLMQRLPDVIHQEGFRDLERYLRNDGKGIKLFQLAAKIAAAFDQYLVFRPEMISAWEDGRGDHWQARLWRILAEESGFLHRTRLRERFFERIGGLDETSGLPERVCIFGISYLPRFHLSVLAALAQVIPVHLFLMNPCEDYWGDIVSDRESRRIEDRYQAREQDTHWLHLERGNSLLASMGVLGRDFLNAIVAFECEYLEFFEEIPGKKTLLSAIQSDILHLITRQPSEGSGPDLPDPSLQIHACHSPMREIEVLHDQLLSMFDEDPALEPQDILVMTPDIELHAPFVRAIFGGEGGRCGNSLQCRGSKRSNHQPFD